MGRLGRYWDKGAMAVNRVAKEFTLVIQEGRRLLV